MTDRLGTEQLAPLAGYPVSGPDGKIIGTLERVFIDPAAGQPAWLGLRTGFGGWKTVLAPAPGARLEGGYLRIPYRAKQVKQTPFVDVFGASLTPETKQALDRAYGRDEVLHGASPPSQEVDAQRSRFVPHPDDALSPHQRRVAAAVSLAAAVTIHRWMGVPAAKTPLAPHGILSFALTGRSAKEQSMWLSWPPDVRRHALRNLRADILFSLLWANALSLGCREAATALHNRGWPGARVGGALVWAQTVAALGAIGKDMVRLQRLKRRRPIPPPRPARWVTIAETALKGLGVAYTLAGGAAWLSTRRPLRRLRERDSARAGAG